MDITDPRVIPSTQAWLEEALFISPRQLLMLPGGTQQEWEQLATELAIADPAHSIVDLRWRRSRNSSKCSLCALSALSALLSRVHKSSFVP